MNIWEFLLGVLSFNHKSDVKDFVFSWEGQNLIGPFMIFVKNSRGGKGGQHDQHCVKNKFVKTKVRGRGVNLNLDYVCKYTVCFFGCYPLLQGEDPPPQKKIILTLIKVILDLETCF